MICLIAMFIDNRYCYLNSVVFFLGSRGFQKVKEIKFDKQLFTFFLNLNCLL